MNRIFVLAIDGPSASGKSSVARMIAARFKWMHIDSGAMFRVIALHHRRYPSEDILSYCREAKFKFNISDDCKHTITSVNGKDMSVDIRSEKVAAVASQLATRPEIRNAIMQKQRFFADECEKDGIVMDGRDIGSVIFPNADLKVYIDASVEERARRRLAEHKESMEDLQQKISERDYADMNRKVGPLIKAKDALVINTDELTLKQVVDQVEKEVRKRLSKREDERL